jgi:hypothetical protein
MDGRGAPLLALRPQVRMLWLIALLIRDDRWLIDRIPYPQSI